MVNGKVSNRITRHQGVGQNGDVLTLCHFRFTDNTVETILNRLVACKDRVVHDLTRFLELPDTVLVSAGAAAAGINFVFVAAEILFWQIVHQCRIFRDSFRFTAGSRIGHSIGLPRVCITAGGGHTHCQQQKCRHTQTNMFCVFHTDTPFPLNFSVTIIQ